MRIVSLLYALPLLLASCHEKPAPKVEQLPAAALEPLKKGVVLDSVHVSSAPNESYAAYVPSGETQGDQLPLLSLFDSHGRGKMVVEKYKDLMEEMKVILLVSNTSRNGLPPETAIAIGKRMRSDVIQRTTASDKVNWVGGFSGGARVACQWAMEDPSINGVVGIGASYNPSQLGDRELDFFGIVGLKDFNFREMISVDSIRRQQGQGGFLWIHEGGHEWPSPVVLGKAIEWQRLECIREGVIAPAQDVKFDPLAEWKSIQQSQPLTQALEKKMHLDYLISAYSQLADISPLENEIDKLIASPGYLGGIKARNNSIIWEAGKIEELQPQIGSGSMSQWDATIAALLEGTVKNILVLPEGMRKNDEMGFANQRVLNFLSLMFYMQSNGALQQGNLAAADHFLTLYAKVDPTNSEHAYLRASYWAMQAKNDLALTSLSESVALGFNDRQRMVGDPQFQALRGDARFQELAGKIR